MKTLKSKIMTLKYARALFAIIFLIGTGCFLFITFGINSNILKNGSVSVVLMVFGFSAVEWCNKHIQYLTYKYKQNFKDKKIKKCKIVEFDKIA